MKYKKLLPVHHTGKIRHHRHTSYGALALALLLTLVPLMLASRSIALAAADPVTAENGVYAVVQAPRPTTAPVIISPVSGRTFNDVNPVAISGRCPNDTLLKVYKNEVLAGVTLCQNGNFSIQVDLFVGPNTIIVRPYNATNDVGPESAPLIVLKQLPNITVTNSAQQFFITSDVYFKGVSTGTSFSWPLTLSGGQAPYAISVAWGDGKTDLISRGVLGTFNLQHTYEKSGNGYKGSYDVTIIATDALGDKSFIHLIAIVSGNTSIVGSVEQSYNWSGAMRIAWQIMLAAVLLVLAFWLGERRESYLVKKKVRTA